MPRTKRPNAASIKEALKNPNVSSVRLQLTLKVGDARKLHSELQESGKHLTRYAQDAIKLSHTIRCGEGRDGKLLIEMPDGKIYRVLL